MPPQTLLLATRNADKIVEIKEALRGLDIELISAASFAEIPEVEEDQPDLTGNAIKKAVTLARLTGMTALADDTGLEVDALNGAPGVFSSRYSGPNATYASNVQKLLLDLQGIEAAQRTARFRCVIAIARGEQVSTVEGVCEGLILEAPQGSDGFGYDPVFMIPDLRKTFAELSVAEKNFISHRGQALRKARVVLEDIFQS